MNAGHRATVSNPTDPAPGGHRAPAPTAHGTVRDAVSAWDKVTEHEHIFGGLEFRVGRRQLGHLHGTFADLPFTRRVRDELVGAGRARPHHVHPDSGWVSVPMRTDVEAANVIDLFRRNYERAVAARR